MERADRAPVGTFHAPGEWASSVELGEGAAHHASVKRLKVGDLVRLTNGAGRRALGTIEDLARRRLLVTLDRDTIVQAEAPAVVELWAPVGDRERMLLLAEKAVELGASVWRPVVYRRSRSVSPRGDGEGFRDRVRARMIGALEQSGGAWLPAMHAEAPVDAALHARSVACGVVLALEAPPLASIVPGLRPPIAIALGPEGGLDPDERDAFVAAGWRAASLGANVLRFETAGIAALAIVRSLLP